MHSSGDVCCYEVGRISLLMGNIQHMNGWLDLILKVYSNNTLLCTSQVLVISLMFTTEYTCVGGSLRLLILILQDGPIRILISVKVLTRGCFCWGK